MFLHLRVILPNLIIFQRLFNRKLPLNLQHIKFQNHHYFHLNQHCFIHHYSQIVLQVLLLHQNQNYFHLHPTLIHLLCFNSQIFQVHPTKEHYIIIYNHTISHSSSIHSDAKNQSDCHSNDHRTFLFTNNE